MQIILKKDIEKLGKAGDVVTVKAGYARNFLFPKALALPASPANLEIVEREKSRFVQLEQKKKQKAQELAEKINFSSCTIPVRVGPDGKLFGSVTSHDIVQAYKAEGIEIDKRQVELTQPIKEIGVFKVAVKLHPEVTAEAKVWIVKE
jgi:large subunit ribosomal protein L9